MIVNVASHCGLTPQYDELQQLYEKYKEDWFVIIAFPANNFKEQEPGTNAEIKEFCSVNFNITFPIMSKISVKGDDIAPIFQWLTSTTKSDVSWNFQKFLIDRNGYVVKSIPPKTSPMDKEIIEWISGY